MFKFKKRKNKDINKSIIEIDERNFNKADLLFRVQIGNILRNGFLDENPRPKYQDGTPAHTYSVNQNWHTYDLNQGEFPITTLRRMYWKSAIKEMLWIMQDQTSDLSVLRDKYNIKVWDQWESKDVPNTIGYRYGETIRRYDLVNKLIKELKEDPFGRRHIIDLYQYADFQATDGLYPCAFMTMWNVRKGDSIIDLNNPLKEDKDTLYLDMTLIQRSGDCLVASHPGGWNEIQYAALLMMVAQVCGYKPGVFGHFIQNEQIYDRHIEQAKDLIKRQSIIEDNKMPMLKLNPDIKDFYDFTIDDFEMINYPTKDIDEKNPQLSFDMGI